MSETAAERGRRFAERWEGMAEAAPGLSAWFAFGEHKHTNAEAAKVVRLRGEFCATRARWLRHAVLAMEERERAIYRERAELAEADLLGTLPEVGRARLAMLDDALDQIECGGRR